MLGSGLPISLCCCFNHWSVSKTECLAVSFGFLFKGRYAPLVWPKYSRGHIGDTQAVSSVSTGKSNHRKTCKFSLTFSFGQHKVCFPVESLDVKSWLFDAVFSPFSLWGALAPSAAHWGPFWVGYQTLHAAVQLLPVPKYFRRRFRF